MQFISKFRKLRIVVKPQKRIIIGTETTLTDGLTVSFRNFEFSTEDETLIEFLRKHKQFGVWFWERPEVDLTKAPEVNARITELEKEIASLKGEDGKPKVYKCDQCDFASSTGGGLAAHKRFAHKQKTKESF